MGSPSMCPTAALLQSPHCLLLPLDLEAPLPPLPPLPAPILTPGSPVAGPNTSPHKCPSGRPLMHHTPLGVLPYSCLLCFLLTTKFIGTHFQFRYQYFMFNLHKRGRHNCRAEAETKWVGREVVMEINFDTHSFIHSGQQLGAGWAMHTRQRCPVLSPILHPGRATSAPVPSP